jgi:ubiquinone/menaquinone biosynthesis C-methylase UbiE
MDAVAIQRAYYRETADTYDAGHAWEEEPFNLSLALLSAAVNTLKITTVLDVGSGTGRALLALKAAHPQVRCTGIEPSAELRERGYSKGLPRDTLIDGDAERLSFRDGAFDIVCAFAVLHHVPRPKLAVSEMLRVARRAIFIADSNNFGQGNAITRLIKQIINAAGLWPLADLVKTRGKGYTISDGDGLAYSYSVFNNYKQISSACERVHCINTTAAGPNLYRSAPGVALLGIKTATKP